MKLSAKIGSLLVVCLIAVLSAGCGGTSSGETSGKNTPFERFSSAETSAGSTASQKASTAESPAVPVSSVPSPQVSSPAATISSPSAEEWIEVPPVVGLTAAEADSMLKGAGLTVSVSEVYSDAFYPGYVIEQIPSDGIRLHKEDKVQLTVSLGTEPSHTTESSVSPEPSEDPAAQEKAILQHYAETMSTAGTLKTMAPYTTSWKINQFVIDDLNHDGSPELVVQYYCGVSSEGAYAVHNEKQGIALKICKVVNGGVIEYANTADLNYYIRLAGADIGQNPEITDELFIDEDGSLGILTTRTHRGSDTTLLYNMNVLKNGILSHKDGFAMTELYESGRYGMGAPLPDPQYWFMVSENNTYDRLFIFRRINDVFQFGENYIGLAEIREAYAALDTLQKVPAFRVTEQTDEMVIRPQFMSYLSSDFYLR